MFKTMQTFSSKTTDLKTKELSNCSITLLQAEMNLARFMLTSREYTRPCKVSFSAYHNIT